MQGDIHPPSTLLWFPLSVDRWLDCGEMESAAWVMNRKPHSTSKDGEHSNKGPGWERAQERGVPG